VDVTGALQSADEALLRLTHGSPPWSVPVFYAATVVGAGWGLAALVPFAWAQRTRRATLRLLGAVVVTNLLVVFFKWLFGRVRPCDALAWCDPIHLVSPGGDSFPSGHAAGAFVFAGFIAVAIPRYAAPAMLYAGLVAWSRCVLGVHYPFDVLAGSALGAVVGVLFARSLGDGTAGVGSATKPDAMRAGAG